jgi:hypothetical protein
MFSRLSAVSLLALISPLLAELPPSAYEAMQREAPEFVKIEVLRVEIEPGAEAGEQKVTAVALVGHVERSASGLKPGDLITISYGVRERPKDFVGPGQIPILEERTETIAFLKPTDESSTYTPAAGAMSFSQF